MTSRFSITPRSVLVDMKTGQPTRELFLLLDYLDSISADFATLILIQAVTNGVTDKAPSSNAVYDAVAAVAAIASGVASSLASDYTTTTGLPTALLEDAINDGVSNKAPTENAVFDALAGKLGVDGGSLMTGPLVLASYTVAGVPAVASYTGGLIYVSNESGGATVAYSNGTNWRRVYDNAIIS